MLLRLAVPICSFVSYTLGQWNTCPKHALGKYEHLHLLYTVGTGNCIISLKAMLYFHVLYATALMPRARTHSISLGANNFCHFTMHIERSLQFS